MTLGLNPPPLQVPPSLLSDKQASAFFSGLINTIYQIWNALYNIRFNAKVKTTDATTTALIRTKVADSKTVMLVCYIVARRTGGTSGTAGDSAFYVLTGAYKNIAGVLTGIGTPDLVAGEDQAAWNVGFSTSGTDAIVTVTGAANNDVTWEGTLSVYEVGS